MPPRSRLFGSSGVFCQAEDGIRDWSVTGVQTCALPICDARRSEQHEPEKRAARRAERDRRSEERRVGKEWRTRDTQDERKTKQRRQSRSMRPIRLPPHTTYRGVGTEAMTSSWSPRTART